jgi:ABC-type transport system involved in multi-copper enzyme maturation permease subunit
MSAALLTVYHILRADFWERVRRYSFLIVLGLTIYAGYLLMPAADAPYATLVRGSYRGVYNAAWVGNLFGSVAVLVLPLFGFFLVKSAITRDYQTGVGQIIATTPISRPLYMLGKWLSNLAVLASILSILTVMALVMQLIRAEDVDIQLWAMIAPIWLMGLPVLAIWSAFAVVFESIPLLRGGFGNVVAFFLWGALMSSWAPSYATLATPSNDLLGISRSTASIQRQILAIDPSVDITSGGMFYFKVSFVEGQNYRPASTFTWEGPDWTGGVVLERLMWLGVAVIIALAASIPFDRFDPSRHRTRGKGRYGPPGASAVEESPGPASASATTRNPRDIHLSPLGQQRSRWQVVRILGAELRLMLKGQKPLWFAVALGFFVAILAAPLDIVQAYILPAACLWPILIWSGMGTRERRHQTEALVFSVARPLRLQLPAIWLAGVLVALVSTGSAGVRFALIGQWGHVLAWGVGVLFVPSLALALGVWSGSGKLFEVVYIMLWYVGALNRMPLLDYMGISNDAIDLGIPLCYLGITIVLLGLCQLGRRRQIYV